MTSPAPPSQDLSSLVDLVARLLAERGGHAYAVGGYVRDVLLGREARDLDIALAGDDPLGAARAVAEALGGSAFVLDATRGHARALVPLQDSGTAAVLDFSPLRGTVEQDLARRDFTIDAMALPLEALMGRHAPLAALVVDPWGGRQDLERRLVRTLGEVAYQEDPGRLLRTVRLAGELGFAIEEDTAGLVRAHARRVRDVAPERARDELCRTLALPRSQRWLQEMDRLGLLTELLPELTPARGVAQPPEHYWDVYSHLLETVGAFERIADRQEREQDPLLASVPWQPAVDTYFDHEVGEERTRRTLTKLACLLHDVAKPQTRTVEPSGRMRFFGHAEQGAAMARGALERLRFSRRETAFITTEVEEHLRPMQLSQDLEPPTRRALYRYFRDLGEAALATLYLSLADYLAARGPRLEREDWRSHAAHIGLVVAAACGPDLLEGSRRPPLVDGHLLMRELGLAPGPLLGRMLALVQEAEAAGEVTTAEEGLALARRLLAEAPGPLNARREG